MTIDKRSLGSLRKSQNLSSYPPHNVAKGNGPGLLLQGFFDGQVQKDPLRPFAMDVVDSYIDIRYRSWVGHRYFDLQNP
jgi:hypothetical protein